MRQSARWTPVNETNTHQGEDLLPLLYIRKAYGEALRHTAENRRINVVWAVRSSKDKYPVCTGCQTVPQPDIVGGAMGGRADSVTPVI